MVVGPLLWVRLPLLYLRKLAGSDLCLVRALALLLFPLPLLPTAPARGNYVMICFGLFPSLLSSLSLFPHIGTLIII